MCWKLNYMLVVFEGGAFARSLGLEEVMRVGPCDGISGFMGRGREA